MIYCEEEVSPEFGINSPRGFWENEFYGRTGGRADERRTRDVAVLCSSTKQS